MKRRSFFAAVAGVIIGAKAKVLPLPPKPMPEIDVLNRFDVLYGFGAITTEYACGISDEDSEWEVANQKAVAGLAEMERRAAMDGVLPYASA